MNNDRPPYEECIYSFFYQTGNYPSFREAFSWMDANGIQSPGRGAAMVRSYLKNVLEKS